MSVGWQDQIVESAADVEPFIMGHMKISGLLGQELAAVKVSMNGNGYPNTDYNPNASGEFALIVVGQGADPQAAFSRQLHILFSRMSFEASRECVVQNFTVANFEKRGLGLIAAKSLLGVAYERGIESIRLRSIRGDGLSFWSILGALPSMPPDDLAKVIRNVVREGKEAGALSDHDMSLTKLEAIAQVAEEYPFRAWRQLSQTSHAFLKSRFSPHRFVKGEIFKRLCKEESDLLLIPGESSTQHVLGLCLGKLPPFRPLGAKSAYGYLRREISLECRWSSEFQPG